MQRTNPSGDLKQREHYIPLRPEELIERLANEPAVTIFEKQQFLDLCQLAQSVVHHDCHANLQQLLACYAPFHPDDDAARKFAISDTRREASGRQLFREFETLLTRANYRRLSNEEIAAAVRSPSTAGLRLMLDLAVFERLDVYVRGECLLDGQHPASRWRKPAVARQVPAYRRLAIIFRLKERNSRTDPLDTRAVVLKLFKDIPCEDLEALLPGTWVQLGLIEQAKIVLPTVSGLAITLLKLLKGAAAVTFASIYGLAAFLGLVGGAVGYGVKSFFSYVNLREKYQLSLTRRLYYQNLDNNAGVIYHLLAEAEQQELRELVLSWWLLWRGGMEGCTEKQIDVAAERWLREKCGVTVDFEVNDALAKLQRLSIAFVSPSGRWHAVAVEEALERLDRYWDGQFEFRRTSEAAAGITQPQIYRRAA